jgi:hypothetical protein
MGEALGYKTFGSRLQGVIIVAAEPADLHDAADGRRVGEGVDPPETHTVGRGHRCRRSWRPGFFRQGAP